MPTLQRLGYTIRLVAPCSSAVHIEGMEPLPLSVGLSAPMTQLSHMLERRAKMMLASQERLKAATQCIESTERLLKSVNDRRPEKRNEKP